MAKQKILIATNNLSKFKVIEPLIKQTGLVNFDYARPEELGIEFNVTETGSLQNRARLKAVKLYDVLKASSKIDDVFMIVGSDDGIRIDDEKKTYSDSKMATDRILKGDRVKLGDSITIVRAFAFVSQNGDIKSCIARVPMVFIGNPGNIKRQEGVYPLEHVLAYIGSSKPIYSLDLKSRNNLNQKYMLPVIEKELGKFN